MLEEFIAYLEEQVNNRSIYVWGAQGQKRPLLCEKWIERKESALSHKNAALKLYRAGIEAGHADDMRAFDCSGLGMYWLYNLKGYTRGDMNANGMKGRCTLITKDALKKGCWVFRVYTGGSKKNRAYHIGYVVDDYLNVVEAKGRAYGVVKRPFDSNYWNAYGIPEFFEDEILARAESGSAKFYRLLKKGSGGSDVKALQRLLNELGGCELAQDGVFGAKTLAAVKEYQRSRNLAADGIVGEKTVAALGGVWLG